MYATIQAFRQDYLSQMENPDICPFDHVFDRRDYIHFMNALKFYMEKKMK